MVDHLWHAQSKQDVLDRQETSLSGLSLSEVKKRRDAGGLNELPRDRRLLGVVVLARQFTSPLMLILLLAGLMSAWLGEYVDMWVIFVAVALNALIGFIQEWKANHALESLRQLTQPHARVRREGHDQMIPARELVCGDILLFERGDQVTADARLIETQGLLVDEATLTGESTPVEKQIRVCVQSAAIGDRLNMMHAGSSVMAGSAVAVVVAIGKETQLGRIASLVAATQDESTPLQNQIKKLAKWISLTIVVLVVALFLFGVARGTALFEMFQLSVALAVAAIPEGLLIAITISLAIGTQRLLRNKSLVRRLVAAETLGSVSVICSDKTGTITQGAMSLEYTESPLEKKDLLSLAVLGNDGGISQTKEGVKLIGSSTQKAFLQAALDEQIDVQAVRARTVTYQRIAFDSTHKFEAAFIKKDKDTTQIIVVGAPERLFLLSGSPAKWMKKTQALAQEGYRVLAVATKTIKKKKTYSVQDIVDVEVVGLFGLRDPIRPEAREQIARAKGAGVRTVMITGDHQETAFSIAQAAGITSSKKRLVLGEELDTLSDEALQKRVQDIDVYARVSPEHKIRIVRAFQAQGEVVAMTGDGVNDAPALRAADIGIALGSGTQVAKEASDMVLLDSNLSVITKAIEQGRSVFDNIRKTTVYLMTSSFTEMILITGALLFGFPLPLLPVQILWINLVADSLPNIGLTFEQPESDTMQRPPRPRHESLLNKEMLTYIFFIGIMTDVILLGLFWWMLSSTGNPQYAQTMIFAAVGIASIIYVFAIRQLHTSIFRSNPFSNLWLTGAVGIGMLAMLAALYVPVLQTAFSIYPLGVFDLTVLLLIGLVKFIGVELAKEWFNHKRQKKTL